MSPFSLFSGRREHHYFSKSMEWTAVEKCYPGHAGTLCQHLDIVGHLGSLY